jgi:hypothetical protein
MARRATKTGNKNQRPNSQIGRELKVWMLAEFGDGITVPCSFGCGRQLFFSEITKDRYPVPGRKGGRYTKDNIRPACMSCNAREGARQAALERAIQRAKCEVRNARRRMRYMLRRKGEIIFMADHVVAESAQPEWSSQEASQILAAIQAVLGERRATSPRSMVFEYSPHVEANRAYFMKRELFDDGRHRVFLHPTHEKTVETWLKTL